MSGRLDARLAAAKAALIAGNPAEALRSIEDFVAIANRRGLSAVDRPGLEARIAELRNLAEASLLGARQASDDIQAIIAAAGSLQTYDGQGARHHASTIAPAPHRF